MMTCLLLSGALALGGWGSACGPVGPAESDTQWRRFASDPGRSYLYRDGVQVAAYDHAGAVYRRYDAQTDRWGPPETPPWRRDAESNAAPPEQPAEAVPNYGVDLDKLNGNHEERYRLNGVPVSRARAHQAMGVDSIPDDASRLRLTVIGDAATAGRVTNDLVAAPALAAWKDRFVVQAYPPEHWAVAKAGFFTGGRPTIYVQAPSGKVIHRQDDYADGPEGLAKALRRADPDYDPKKDADLRRTTLPFLDFARVPRIAWVIVAAVLFLWIRSRA